MYSWQKYPVLTKHKMPCHNRVLINLYIASCFLRKLGHNRISEVPSGAFIHLKDLGFLYVDITMCVTVRVTYSRQVHTSINGDLFSSDGCED